MENINDKFPQNYPEEMITVYPFYWTMGLIIYFNFPFYLVKAVLLIALLMTSFTSLLLRL